LDWSNTSGTLFRFKRDLSGGEIVRNSVIFGQQSRCRMASKGCRKCNGSQAFHLQFWTGLAGHQSTINSDCRFNIGRPPSTMMVGLRRKADQEVGANGDRCSDPDCRLLRLGDGSRPDLRWCHRGPGNTRRDVVALSMLPPHRQPHSPKYGKRQGAPKDICEFSSRTMCNGDMHRFLAFPRRRDHDL
jgi:hypothetical protein